MVYIGYILGSRLEAPTRGPWDLLWRTLKARSSKRQAQGSWPRTPPSLGPSLALTCPHTWYDIHECLESVILASLGGNDLRVYLVVSNDIL